MIIRYLTQNDVSQHDRVASQAFVFSCDIRDPGSVLPCEKVLGAFDDDNKTLFADFELYERTCFYDGGTLSCAAIGGVAAKPEHRGRGAVKALFQTLFREEKYDISVLYPFSETYYRKLGYERTGRSVSALIPFSELSGIKRNRDAVLYEGESPGELLALYNRCAEGLNLCFRRDTAEAFSADPYLSQRFTYVWKDRSLATFSVDRAKSTVNVRELWFDSCEAMLGIVGFLRNFEANQKNVCFQNLPENTPLLDLVGNMRNCEVALHSVGAARLLRPETVLRAHRYPRRDGGFAVRIGGDVYQVSFSADSVDVVKNGGRAPDASMDIALASQLLLCGFRDAAFIPGLTVHDPQSDFFRVFPPKTTFFSDNL